MANSDKQLLRIAVVDDHQLYRRGLMDVLKGWSVPHTVLEAENGVDYEQRCREQGHVHLALVDLRMPQRDGYETMQWIRRHQQRTVALAITYDPAPAAVMRALQCHAYGVLDKAVEPAELYRAMACALRKEVYVNDLVTAQLRRTARSAEVASPAQSWATLTAREREFVRCYTRPDVDTLEEVGRHMGISRHTAETYRRNVYEKLGLHSKKELMHFVLTNQLD